MPEIDGVGGGGATKPLAISLLMKNNGEVGGRKISNRTQSLLPYMKDSKAEIPPKRLRSRNLVPINSTTTFSAARRT